MKYSRLAIRHFSLRMRICLLVSILLEILVSRFLFAFGVVSDSTYYENFLAVFFRQIFPEILQHRSKVHVSFSSESNSQFQSEFTMKKATDNLNVLDALLSRISKFLQRSKGKRPKTTQVAIPAMRKP